MKKRDTRTVSPVGPVLSSNRNYSYRLNMRRPCFSTWLQGGAFLASAVHTWALHRAPYSLEALAEPIPTRWRRPRITQTGNRQSGGTSIRRVGRQESA